jgi:starvation-inducible DNA-binding protein
MTIHSQIEPDRYRKDLPPHRANRPEIPVALSALLPEMFALYLETKNLHRHAAHRQFRGCHLLLDDQAAQILATTDLITERIRKLGGRTIAYIGHIGRIRHIENDDEVKPGDMLAKLLKHNRRLVWQMRKTHTLCAERGDVVSARLVENWIDEAEGRAWFLRDAARPSERSGRDTWSGHRGHGAWSRARGSRAATFTQIYDG